MESLRILDIVKATPSATVVSPANNQGGKGNPMLGIDVLLFILGFISGGVQLRLPGRNGIVFEPGLTRFGCWVLGWCFGIDFGLVLAPAEVYYFAIYRLPRRYENMDKRTSRNMLTFRWKADKGQSQG
jgi:hypothetical protein